RQRRDIDVERVAGYEVRRAVRDREVDLAGERRTNHTVADFAAVRSEDRERAEVRSRFDHDDAIATDTRGRPHGERADGAVAGVTGLRRPRDRAGGRLATEHTATHAGGFTRQQRHLAGRGRR